MKITYSVLGLLILFLIIGGTCMNVLGFLGFGDSLNWKEEVQLHDGNRIIVSRVLIRKGRHEIGQIPPIKEHSITFTVPGTDKPISWKSEYTEDIGHSNFGLLVLDIVKGIPYVVCSLTGCLSYNKWGRPNPPYIFFKYENQQWKQIPLTDLPKEITKPNVSLDINDKKIKSEEKQTGYVSASSISKSNNTFKQDHLKTILREPLLENALCPDWSSPRYTSPKAPFPIYPEKAGQKK